MPIDIMSATQSVRRIDVYRGLRNQFPVNFINEDGAHTPRHRHRHHLFA